MTDPISMWTQAVAASAIHFFDIVGRAMEGPYTVQDARADLGTCAAGLAGPGAAALNTWLDAWLPDHPPISPDDPTVATVLLPPDTPTNGLWTPGFRIMGEGPAIAIDKNHVVITKTLTPMALVVTLGIWPNPSPAPPTEVIYEADLLLHTVDANGTPTDTVLATARLPWFEQQPTSP
jgi:hypothetical protein